MYVAIIFPVSECMVVNKSTLFILVRFLTEGRGALKRGLLGTSHLYEVHGAC